MVDTAAHIATRLPAVPLTLEGHSVLHQMFRFRWAAWRKVDEARQKQIAA
jgi:chlorite dismutase